MSFARPSIVTTVTVKWLKRALVERGAGAAAARRLIVVDGSYILPKRDNRAAWEKARLPNARFFDIDAVCATSAPNAAADEPSLPHMLPEPEVFGRWCMSNGIDITDPGAAAQHDIVVYDSHEQGIFGAPRVAFTFRYFGFAEVGVLDGGLQAWVADGGGVEPGVDDNVEPLSEQSAAAVAAAAAQLLVPARERVASLADVIEASRGRDVQILDARSLDRFAGRQEEPRAGLKCGHMPNAINVPFKSLIAADGTMKEPDELRHIFDAAGVDCDKPIIVSCGSGVTACVLELALRIVNASGSVRVYDGSFAEYGQLERENCPVLAGEG